MVKIRLTRVGAKKRPFYRVLAIDERKKRDGRALEYLGTYDPTPAKELLQLRTEAIEAWVAKGAQLSDTVRSLLKRYDPEQAVVPAEAEAVAEAPAPVPVPVPEPAPAEEAAPVEDPTPPAEGA